MAEKREPFNPLLKSYPDSEKVNACSLGAETLFTRLIAQSDDYAHYYADPQMVCAKLYTLRMVNGGVKSTDVAAWIGELEAQGLIILYEVGGKPYLEIVNCRKALRGDVKRDERFPQRRNEEHAQQDSPALTDAARARNESVTNPARTRDDAVTHAARIRDEPVTLTQPNLPQPNPLVSDEGGEKDGTDPGLASPAPSGERGQLTTGVPEYPPGLTTFWNSYPAKGRDRSTRKKCERFWQRLKLEPKAAEIVASVETWKRCEQWTKNEGQFVPAADRFLRDEMFNDTPTGRTIRPANVLNELVTNR